MDGLLPLGVGCFVGAVYRGRPTTPRLRAVRVVPDASRCPSEAINVSHRAINISHRMIMFTRVPKCGTTSFQALLQQVQPTCANKQTMSGTMSMYSDTYVPLPLARKKKATWVYSATTAGRSV